MSGSASWTEPMPTGVPSVAPVESLIHLFGVMFGIGELVRLPSGRIGRLGDCAGLGERNLHPDNFSSPTMGTVIAVRAVLVTVSPAPARLSRIRL